MPHRGEEKATRNPYLSDFTVMMIAMTATKMPLGIHNSLLFIPVPHFCHSHLDAVVMYTSKAFSETISRKSRLVMANTKTPFRNGSLLSAFVFPAVLAAVAAAAGAKTAVGYEKKCSLHHLFQECICSAVRGSLAGKFRSPSATLQLFLALGSVRGLVFVCIACGVCFVCVCVVLCLVCWFQCLDVGFVCVYKQCSAPVCVFPEEKETRS